MNAIHCIDRAWCDLQGVFLQGWAHCGPKPFDTLLINCAGRQQAVGLYDREDVRAAFPQVPQDQPTGFEVYLACPPFQPVTLQIGTAARLTDMLVTIQDARSAGNTPETEDDFSLAGFAAAMKARGGAVLEIGARVVGPHSSLNAPLFQPECRFIGCDIHPAPGIDLVADAHFLSDSVQPGSLDGIFSLAVLEHLAAPWLVAAEVNRTLRIGGETLHIAPHAWPAHEQPNDFWRFSEAALTALFGPVMGFEVLEARLSVPFQVIPPPSYRHGAYLQLPLHPAFGRAYIRSRKVAEVPDRAVAWPLSRASSVVQSRAYPGRA